MVRKVVVAFEEGVPRREKKSAFLRAQKLKRKKKKFDPGTPIYVKIALTIYINSNHRFLFLLKSTT